MGVKVILLADTSGLNSEGFFIGCVAYIIYSFQITKQVAWIYLASPFFVCEVLRIFFHFSRVNFKHQGYVGNHLRVCMTALSPLCTSQAFCLRCVNPLPLLEHDSYALKLLACAPLPSSAHLLPSINRVQD